MDNAAFRLAQLLERTREVPKNVSVAEGWKSLLDATDDTVHEKLAQVISLVSSAKNEIYVFHPDELGAASQWERELIVAFTSVGLANRWSDFTARFSDSTISILRSHAKLINYENPTRVISPEQVTELREEALSLRQKVASSSLSDTSKKTLLFHLNSLISALENYTVFGSRIIVQESDRIIGKIASNRELKADISETEVGSSLSELVSKIANVVSIASGSAQLIEQLSKLLGKG